MIKKKYLAIAFFIIVMITAYNAVRKEKLNQEATNLELDDVLSWLKKHKVIVPEDLEKSIRLDTYVLDVIYKAKEGIDDSVDTNNKKSISFIHAIQKAAGYSFNK